MTDRQTDRKTNYYNLLPHALRVNNSNLLNRLQEIMYNLWDNSSGNYSMLAELPNLICENQSLNRVNKDEQEVV